MAALSQDYIALYGANCNEEGATLNIYNIQFKVTQAKQSFKLYNNGTQLWLAENNLLFCVGQNLAVVPFHLHMEQLAALIGSHKLVNDKDADVAIVHTIQEASWGEEQENDIQTDTSNLNNSSLTKTSKKNRSSSANNSLNSSLLNTSLANTSLKQNTSINTSTKLNRSSSNNTSSQNSPLLNKTPTPGKYKKFSKSPKNTVSIESNNLSEGRNNISDNNQIQLIPSKLTPTLRKLCSDFFEQGWSESAIAEEILPQLIENHDLESINDILNYFTNIPESCIAKLLKYMLNRNEFKRDTFESLPEGFQSNETCEIINHILQLPYTDLFLLQYIRKELDLDDTLSLLNYIVYLFSENSLVSTNDCISFENVLISWSNLILDANFIKILLSKDNKISIVLNKFNELVKEYLLALDVNQKILPVVTSMLNQKNPTETKNLNLPYSIELLSLY